jgi:hypothetical protein
MVTLSPLRFSAECLTRAAQVEGRGGHLLIRFDRITLGTGAPDPAAQAEYAMHAHGAVFAEVKVDPAGLSSAAPVA